MYERRRCTSPIYEGEDSVIAYVLSGPGKKYKVPLPRINEPKKAILETLHKRALC